MGVFDVFALICFVILAHTCAITGTESKGVSQCRDSQFEQAFTLFLVLKVRLASAARKYDCSKRVQSYGPGFGDAFVVVWSTVLPRQDRCTSSMEVLFALTEGELVCREGLKGLRAVGSSFKIFGTHVVHNNAVSVDVPCL